MITGIPEAASEKRGRPTLFEPWQVDKIGTLFTNAKSRRGRQNGWYIGQAVNPLLECSRRGEDWFAWFLKADSNRPTDIKNAILIELGRIAVEYGNDTMIEWGKELQPCTAKEGAAILRRWRTGRMQVGTVDGLLLHLAKALDAYTATHDTTDEIARAALNKLLEIG